MNGEIGTIIRATHRTEDLIPAFTDELERLDDEGKYKDLIKEARNFQNLSEEEQSFLLNEQLFDALNDFAPDNAYFGAHPGDGSDFGYWESEEED